MDAIHHAGIRRALYVDLDGTLVRTDTLWESLILAAKRHPLRLFPLLARLAGDRAAFKKGVGRLAIPDPSLLPYDAEVLAFVRRHRERGGDAILATAADAAIARAVADHLGVFTAVLASYGRTNNAGAAKRDAVLAHSAGRPFEYMGDGIADEAVFRVAATSHRVVAGSRLPFAAVGDTLRMKQWMKNLLVFVPVFLSHRITEGPLVGTALAAFAAFSFCASAVYVVNDLWDLEADRSHPAKRRRPLARGTMRIPDALAVAAASLVAGFAVAASFLPPAFLLILTGYLFVTSFYTFWLKRITVLDVIVIALCYACRVIAGSVATGVQLSGWLVVFSVFFFLSLAFLKRFSELAMRRSQGLADREASRGYTTADTEVVRLLGVGSGVAAVFVMALYVTNPQVTVLYGRPAALWAVVLATLYWLGRVWLLAGRGAIKDDPFIFTVGDRASYATAALMAIVLAFAS